MCVATVCLLNAHPRQQPPAAKQDNLVRKTEAQDYILAALCCALGLLSFDDS